MIDLTGQNVLIIGCPASGKSTLSKQLSDNNHALIHTDDYIKYGFKEGLYVLINDISMIKSNTIIEGVQGYRLLRKGVELNCYYPDIVIELCIGSEEVFKRYSDSRDLQKLTNANRMHKANEIILKEYKTMHNPMPPKWIRIRDNDYSCLQK